MFAKSSVVVFGALQVNSVLGQNFVHVVQNIWLWKLGEEKVMWVGIIIEKEA